MFNTNFYKMNQNNHKSHFVLWAALLFGQVMMLTVMYLFVAPPDPTRNTDTPLAYVYPFFLLLPVLGNFIGRRRIAAARDETLLADKLETYRSALILRWALCEGAVLLLAMFYFFILGSMQLLVLSGLAILYFTTLYPSKEKLVSDLDLSAAEQAELFG